MSLAPVLDKRRAFKPAKPGGHYVAELERLRRLRVAGVYGILSPAGRWLYVGESHAGTAGRLFDTITRHFRAWKTDPRTDTYGRRSGGTTYDRARVRVVFAITEPEHAESLQFALIRELRPRDNEADGSSLEPAPF